MKKNKALEALAVAIHDRLSNPDRIADLAMLDAGVALLGKDNPHVKRLAAAANLVVAGTPSPNVFEAVIRIQASEVDKGDEPPTLAELRMHLEDNVVLDLDDTSGIDAMVIDWESLTRGQVALPTSPTTVHVEDMQTVNNGPAFDAWEPGMPLPPGDYEVAVVFQGQESVRVVTTSPTTPGEIAERAKAKWGDGDTLDLGNEWQTAERFTIRPISED